MQEQHRCRLIYIVHQKTLSLPHGVGIGRERTGKASHVVCLLLSWQKDLVMSIATWIWKVGPTSDRTMDR